MMKKTLHLIVFISILLAGIIFDLAPIQVPNGVDKICHMLGFAALTASAISCFIAFFGKKAINSFFFFILLFGGLLAGLSETIQNYTLLRSCDVNDWFTNLLGIALMVVIAYLNISKDSKINEAQQSEFRFRDLPALT